MQSDSGMSPLVLHFGGNNSSFKLPKMEISQKKISLGLSSFKSEEFRNLYSFLGQFGSVSVENICYGPSIHHYSDVLVVPNRFINNNEAYKLDSLIDKASFEKVKADTIVYLGKSGLFNFESLIHNTDIRAVKSHKRSSQNGKKMTKTEVFFTPEGRIHLNIPEEVKDKIAVCVDDCLFPRMGTIGADNIILATLKIDGIEYAAAYFNKKYGEYHLFVNPSEWTNLTEGFIYKMTSLKRGDLLSLFVFKKAMSYDKD